MRGHATSGPAIRRISASQAVVLIFDRTRDPTGL